MGTGYTRNDTSNNIASGNVINAADFDGEYDAIEAAFNSTTGHTHDGTSAEGGPVSVIGPAQEYVADASSLSPKTDSTYSLGTTLLRWIKGWFDSVETTGDLTVGGNSAVTGNETVGGTLGVTGATTLSSTLGVTGAATLGSTLGVTGAATLSSTLDVVGAVTVSSTVDGRDIAADGTKLDTVETNADVTDTANVTSAGALMDSEVTSLSGVKTLTVPDNTTISTFGATLVDDASASAARTTLDVPSLSGSNAFTGAMTIAGDVTVDTTTFHVDSTNNRVGIGTASPGNRLDVQSTGNTTARIKANSSGAGNDDDVNLRLDAAETGESNIDFYLDGASTGYSISANTTGGQLNYNVASGGTHDFQVNSRVIARVEGGVSDTLTVGSGGSLSQSTLVFDSGTSNAASISQYNGDDLDINAPGGTVTLQGAFGNSTGFFATSTIFGPRTDNLYDLGSASFRFDDVYATNGTIQTSDIRQKQDIEELNEAELRVALKAKTLLRKYRWKTSVEEKGEEARIHFGIMAQDLIKAFEDEGLDPFKYAVIVGNEEDGYGVRYHELLSFIIATI